MHDDYRPEDFGLEPGPPLVSGEEFHNLVQDSVGVGSRFDFSVRELRRGYVQLRLPFNARYLRPGDAISGPVQFTLADTALFAAVLSVIGMQPLAVTSHLDIHFLRRARPVPLLAEARILKPGRRLMIGDVFLYSEGDRRPVSHATSTYALPPT